MQEIERCVRELKALKEKFLEQEKELEALRGARRQEGTRELLAMLERSQSENKALRRSLKLLTEKRKQDRATIEKWQHAMTHLRRPPPDRDLRSDIPTDETRLDSSPPRKASSLYMESIKQEPEMDVGPGSAPGSAPSGPGAPGAPSAPGAPGAPPSISINALLERDWHPSDFMINPDLNAGVSHAFHEKTLGKARAHLECRDCADCAKFQGLGGKKLESRHRANWSKQSTPPGFWRSGFDTAAESLDRHQAGERIRNEAHERLESAINSGKYLFKDPELREMARRGLIGSRPSRGSREPL